MWSSGRGRTARAWIGAGGHASSARKRSRQLITRTSRSSAASSPSGARLRAAATRAPAGNHQKQVAASIKRARGWRFCPTSVIPGSRRRDLARATPSRSLVEGLGETIGETKRHSSSSSASSLSHVCSWPQSGHNTLWVPEVAALERTFVHRDTRIDGLVRLGASDHDLGDRDSPRHCPGRCKVYAASGTARAWASACESQARTSGRRSTRPRVDPGRRRLP